MTTAETLGEGRWSWRNLLTGLLLLAGIGLAGVGSYFHFTVAAQVRAGHCDGCEPWHPLFVFAPLLIGSALILVGGYLLYQR